MPAKFQANTINRQSRVAEAAFLLLLTIAFPLAVGLQIFPRFSFTLSLVLLNLLQLPSIFLLYRLYLPKTLLKKKFLIFGLLLPFFVLVFELNARCSYFILMRLPVIPVAYKQKLASAHPDSIPPLFIQNLDYTFLILLSAAGFLFFLEWIRRQHTVDLLLADKLQLELDQLKAQVQPHFFFNTLNNLYALSLQGSPKTSVMIANLSGIMRYVLYEAQQPRVLLAKEIAFIHSYLELERVRHTDEDLIRFSVQGNPNGHLVEPLLFLPLIENCFKHSLQKKITGNRVDLFLSIQENELVFQSSNLTDPAPATAEWGGIGLRNVRKRLELLYPGKHQMEVVRENGSFTVTLTLQIL